MARSHRFFPILVALVAASSGLTAPAVADEAASVGLRAPRPVFSGELEILGGLQHTTFGGSTVPLGVSLLVETYSPRREAGVMADVLVGAELMQPDASAAVRGLEVFYKNAWERLDIRGGRLNIVRGGRFRFVDGVDARLALAEHLVLSAWGGAAWHPEDLALFAGGPTWGTDLSYRSGNVLGGGIRYDHVSGEDGLDVDRLGADVSVHLPRLAGFVGEARADVVPAHGVVELVALTAELRPHHRWHLRVEAGSTNPRVDVLPRGGSIYATLIDGPTLYLDGRARVAMARGVATLDAGAVAVGSDDEGMKPGIRAALGLSAHPGRPWLYSARLAMLAGPGGSAYVGLVEVGRMIGPLDVAVLGEQALYQYRGRPWRAATHVGARVGFDPARAVHLSINGQLELGRAPGTEWLVLVVATFRVQSPTVRRPDSVRDRYLSPWSPYRWTRERIPRSPGTVPGADPYPSVPQGKEGSDEG